MAFGYFLKRSRHQGYASKIDKFLMFKVVALSVVLGGLLLFRRLMRYDDVTTYTLESGMFLVSSCGL